MAATYASRVQLCSSFLATTLSWESNSYRDVVRTDDAIRTILRRMQQLSL